MSPKRFVWIFVVCGMVALAITASGPLRAATFAIGTPFLPTATVQPTPPAIVTPQGTPIPAAGVVQSFLRPPYDRETLQRAAQVIETRLHTLGVTDPQVTITRQDHIMVEMPFPVDLDLAIASFRQQGLIRFLHISEHTSPSFRASLVGQMIDPEAYEVFLEGDIFEAASVQPIAADAWTVTFRLKPDAQAEKMALAEAHPTALLLVVLDDMVINIIGAADQIVSGLSYRDAQLLAAFMQSGPLPLPLEHYANDYPPVTATSPPPSATLAVSPSPTGGETITIERTPLFTVTPTRPSNPHVMTGPARVAIHTGPGEAYPVYDSFGPHQGTVILALSADGAWYFIDWPLNRGGPGWIWAAGLETTGGLDRLPVNPGPPAYREDARRLAYTSNGVAHVVNLDTGQDIILGGYGGFNANRTAGSPDGQWVASWHYVRPRWQLSLISTVTWQRTELGEFWARFPTLSWSPDSRWLAFGAQPSGRQVAYDATELFLLNVESGELRRLTFNTYRDDSPSFAPDGERLVFTSAQDGYNRLHILHIPTGERHRLTDQAFGYVPAWSPDGRWIAFASNHEDRHGEIYIIQADGSGLRRVTVNEADDEHPVWIP